MDLGYAVAGLIVGLLIGLTGVGGGSLMTPILILLFGIHPSTAVGTDLLFAASTKTAGTLIHGARHAIEWRIVGLLAAGSLPGAALTLVVLAHLGIHGPAAGHATVRLLAVMLLFTAIALVLKPWLMRASAGFQGQPSVSIAGRFTPGLTIGIGVVIGVLVTACSVGAGVLGTVALLVFYPQLPIARVVGSDIAHAVPLTLLAGVGHWWLGTVDFGLLLPLLAGSLPGIVLGSYGVKMIPESAMRGLLAVVLAVTCVTLLMK